VFIIPSFGNEEYIVGRKEGKCHLLIEKDKSISRKHTVFKLKDNNGEQLEMKDFSKYGTELDGEKLKSGIGYTLNGSNNDHEYTIKFGIFDSVFRVKYEDISFACDHNSAHYSELNKICKDYHFTFSTDLKKQLDTRKKNYFIANDEISYPIFAELLKALMMNYTIVTMDYVRSFCKAFDRNYKCENLPNVNNFAPKVIDNSFPILSGNSAISLVQSSDRSQLFHTKSFVFLDKNSYEFNSTLIELGNGKVSCLTDAEMSLSIQNLEDFFNNYRSSILVAKVNQNEFLSILTKELGFKFVSDEIISASILMNSLVLFPYEIPAMDVFNKYKKKAETIEKERAEEQQKKIHQSEIRQSKYGNEFHASKTGDGEQQEKSETNGNSIKQKEQQQIKAINGESRKRSHSSQVQAIEESQMEGERSIKKQKIEKNEDKDKNNSSNCYICIEYVDLIVTNNGNMKTESSACGSPSVYNAKKFKKAKVGLVASNSQNSFSPSQDGQATRTIIDIVFDQAKEPQSIVSSSRKESQRNESQSPAEVVQATPSPSVEKSIKVSPSPPSAKNIKAVPSPPTKKNRRQRNQQCQKPVLKSLSEENKTEAEQEDEEDEEEEVLDLLSGSITPKKATPKK
jgi:hypothetical protein